MLADLKMITIQRQASFIHKHISSDYGFQFFYLLQCNSNCSALFIVYRLWVLIVSFTHDVCVMILVGILSKIVIEL